MDALITWLLEGQAWVQYRARLDLLGQVESDSAVVLARQAMLADPQVQGLIAELGEWPGAVLNSHKSAGHPLHKLVFLADLGLRADDPGIEPVIARVMAQRSAQGPFQVLMNIPAHFGGSGQDQWAWALCDAPSLVYALERLGMGEQAEAQAALAHLAGLARGNGWPCAASPELGKFRGPGRKEDPCPYANLIMVKALAQSAQWRDSDACRIGAETLLALWTKSREQHPYMFYMGTDFRKLKAPLVWYDILHLLDVLSQLPWLRSDPRLKEIADTTASKADGDGRFTPESIWTSWKDWEFGQKRAPSRWLTLLARRALSRMNMSSR
jgi:hypothetical protein